MDTLTLPKGAAPASKGGRAPHDTHSDQPAALDLQVHGMTCASCVSRVERALARVPGVADPSGSRFQRVRSESAIARPPVGPVGQAPRITSDRRLCGRFPSNSRRRAAVPPGFTGI
jgi:hypothetical protein